MKTLNAWLTYLEQLHPQSIDLGLERIKAVAEQLKLNFTCPVITVGGTNGKGSCIAFLAQIYQAAGYTVAAHTSPHLQRFNERACVNGKEVDDAELVYAFAVVEQARAQISLSYFEFTVLAILYHFQQIQPDIILLEVGLGGRLDAVNIVDADAAVVTSIDLDHEKWLGKTREAIGREKAGIFRQGKPAVCGDANPPMSLFSTANDIGAVHYQIGVDYHFTVAEEDWHCICGEDEYQNLPLPRLAIEHAATALMAITQLQQRLPVNDVAVKQGVAKASLLGRFQVIELANTIVLDVAHNPAAAQRLTEQLTQRWPKRRYRAVVGMLADKDLAGCFTPLLPSIEHWYLADLAVERGADASLLAEKLSDLGAENCYTTRAVDEAFKQACHDCLVDEIVLVFGSFHTVGAVLDTLRSVE